MPQKHEDHLNAFQIAFVCIVLILAFALAGQGDYLQELETENAQLKASTAHCKAISAELEADRIAAHMGSGMAMRGSDLQPAVPVGQP